MIRVSTQINFKLNVMKQAIIFFSCILLLTNCNKYREPSLEKNEAQSLGNIALAKKTCNSDVKWLSDIITKAIEDKATAKYMGAYRGTIYLTTYNNNPIFVIDMMLNSGGVMFHAFDCNYQVIPFTNSEAVSFYAETKANGEIIYSNNP